MKLKFPTNPDNAPRVTHCLYAEYCQPCLFLESIFQSEEIARKQSQVGLGLRQIRTETSMLLGINFPVGWGRLRHRGQQGAWQEFYVKDDYIHVLLKEAAARIDYSSAPTLPSQPIIVRLLTKFWLRSDMRISTCITLRWQNDGRSTWASIHT